MIKNFIIKYKSIIIEVLCALLALLAVINKNEEIFLLDSKNLINILLTLLGLCFTSFGFIESSINSILNKGIDGRKRILLNKKIKKLVEEIRSNIVFIFKTIIILILINTVKNLDFPFLCDICDLNLKIYTVHSLKHFIMNFISTFFFNLSVGCLYDLLDAMFIILKEHYNF